MTYQTPQVNLAPEFGPTNMTAFVYLHLPYL